MNTTIILLIIYHTIVIYAILNVKKMNRFYHIFEQKRRKGRKSHSASKESKIKILHASAGFLAVANHYDAHVFFVFNEIWRVKIQTMNSLFRI